MTPLSVSCIANRHGYGKGPARRSSRHRQEFRDSLSLTTKIVVTIEATDYKVSKDC